MNVTFKPPPAHVKAGEPGPATLLREEALDWFERNDGPPVIAFRFDSPQGLAAKWTGITTSARS